MDSTIIIDSTTCKMWLYEGIVKALTSLRCCKGKWPLMIKSKVLFSFLHSCFNRDCVPCVLVSSIVWALHHRSPFLSGWCLRLQKGLAVCWFYSLFWTLPPLLGWSSYGPEGPGTTCSVQWHLRSPSSILYVLCLFIFCLLLPLLLMLYSYGRILMAIRRVSSEIHEEFHHIFWDDHTRQRENHATTYSATMSFLVVYLCVSKS